MPTAQELNERYQAFINQSNRVIPEGGYLKLNFPEPDQDQFLIITSQGKYISQNVTGKESPVLGEGQFGKVFKVYDVNTGQDKVVKLGDSLVDPK